MRSKKGSPRHLTWECDSVLFFGLLVRRGGKRGRELSCCEQAIRMCLTPTTPVPLVASLLLGCDVCEVVGLRSGPATGEQGALGPGERLGVRRRAGLGRARQGGAG